MWCPQGSEDMDHGTVSHPHPGVLRTHTSLHVGVSILCLRRGMQSQGVIFHCKGTSEGSYSMTSFLRGSNTASRSLRTEEGGLTLHRRTPMELRKSVSHEQTLTLLVLAVFLHAYAFPAVYVSNMEAYSASQSCHKPCIPAPESRGLNSNCTHKSGNHHSTVIELLTSKKSSFIQFGSKIIVSSPSTLFSPLCPILFAAST